MSGWKVLRLESSEVGIELELVWISSLIKRLKEQLLEKRQCYKLLLELLEKRQSKIATMILSLFFVKGLLEVIMMINVLCWNMTYVVEHSKQNYVFLVVLDVLEVE
ncbi:hypothetical protein L195_g028192, partial [Trifolium pratense]